MRKGGGHHGAFGIQARVQCPHQRDGRAGPAECLGVIEKTEYSGTAGAAGKARLLNVRPQGIGLVHIEGAIKGCIVHASLEKGRQSMG